MRLTFVVLMILMAPVASTRSIKGSFDAISDGMNPINGTASVILDLTTTNVTCEPTYGFLPCTTELWGELFLVVVYEYLLALASQYVNTGSQLFFRMFGTGIFGASLFQILGTIPQVIIMLAGAVTSSADTIETTAAMGMAILAGSAIFSLTIVWGSVVAFGSHDLSNSSSSTTSSSSSSSSSSFNLLTTIKKMFALTGYGVETDTETKYIARIMFVSMVPFFILQLAKILNSSSGTRTLVLVTLIITVVYLIVYCTYQIFEPWIQKKRYEYIICLHDGESPLQSLLTINGKPDELRMKELFQKIDQDNDSKVSKAELYAFMLGIQIEEEGFSTDDFADAVMKQFDNDNSTDGSISASEFVQGMCKWFEGDTVLGNNSAQNRSSSGSKSATNNSEETTDETKSLLSQVEPSTTSKGTSTTSKGTSGLQEWWNYTEAGFLIILGTTMMILLGQPLTESLQEFAESAGISSFVITYVLMPLAMSYRQALAGITSAKRKTVKGISGALVEVYNGVFMNNVMGMATFLALVYIKGISWDVSAEVLVVLLICTFMSLLTSFSTQFPFWTSILACALYPVSLLFLYILTSILGWS